MATLRAGSSRSLQLLQRSANQTRYYAQAAEPVQKTGNKKEIKQKRVRQKDKPPAFKALSASQLTHPVFESSQRKALDLAPFHPKHLHREKVGLPTAFAAKPTDALSTFGLPKKMLLEFRLLSKPASVVRGVTIDTVEILAAASGGPSRDTRAVFTGPAGSGKSFLLLQAVEYCKAKDWVVLYIPRAVNLVNSTTPFVYSLRTRTYLQPTYSQQTLIRLLSANEPILSTLKVTKRWEFSGSDKDPQEATSGVDKGQSLKELVKIGVKARDAEIAPAVLEAVLEELGAQKTHPVLFAVDDFQSLYSKTAYKDPHFNGISSYHLSLPRLIMEYASGKKSFTRGAFISAITATDANYSTPIELIDALDLPFPSSMPVDPSTGRPSPYIKRSTTLAGYAEGLKKIAVPNGFSVDEAASVYGVWKEDRALSTRTHDETFMAKYSESGGNPRSFVWNGLLSTLDN